MFDQVYLTGFKVFGNHEVNPTQLISEHFMKHPRDGLRCSVVEVTTKDADAYINKVQQQLVASKGKKVLNLHFGVGPNKVYNLERFCYNNKDFGIPDNDGYQPENEKISAKYPLEHPFHTKIDINQLLSILSKDFKVQLSQNPGRYLCNYIYFKSSHDLSLHNDDVYSLFIHFPVLNLSSHETNVKFVEKLLQIFLKKSTK